MEYHVCTLNLLELVQSVDRSSSLITLLFLLGDVSTQGIPIPYLLNERRQMRVVQHLNHLNRHQVALQRVPMVASPTHQNGEEKTLMSHLEKYKMVTEVKLKGKA